MKRILVILFASIIIVLSSCSTEDPKEDIEIVLLAGQDTVEVNTNWVDEGAKLNVDDTSYNALSNGSVNTSIIGLYSIEYSYKYKDIDYSVTRYVNVVDQINPIITLNAGLDTLVLGESWIDTGASVIDNSEENISVTITGSVNSNILGVYEIIYSAIDSSGNSVSEIRYVHIIE